MLAAPPIPTRTSPGWLRCGPTCVWGVSIVESERARAASEECVTAVSDKTEDGEVRMRIPAQCSLIGLYFVSRFGIFILLYFSRRPAMLMFRVPPIATYVIFINTMYLSR